MKAIRVTEHGGPEVLRLREVDTPPVGPGQARVRLHAAGVNFVDVYQRRGGFGTTDLPFTPGREGAGVVEAPLRGPPFGLPKLWVEAEDLARTPHAVGACQNDR